MQPSHGVSGLNSEYPELILLSDVVRTIWRAKWLVFAIVLFTILCSAVWSMLYPAYLSRGYLRFGGQIPTNVQVQAEAKTPGILAEDYSRYASAILSSARLNEYLQARKLESVAGIEDLKKAFRAHSGAARIIEPIYSFSRLDGNEVKGGRDSPVLGLRISVTATSPEMARNLARIVGQYAMDSIIRSVYEDTLVADGAALEIRAARLQNLIVNKNAQLEDYGQTMQSLKELIGRHPSDYKSGSLPPILATEKTMHFLPPESILIATEVQAIEARNELTRLKRELQQIDIFHAYYDVLEKNLKEAESGEAFLRGLKPAKERVFKNRDMQDIGVRQIFGTITANNQTALAIYLDASHFAPAPDLPDHSMNRLPAAIAGGTIVGLLIALIFVFSSQWWRKNMK
jgi:hypothetical protein